MYALGSSHYKSVSYLICSKGSNIAQVRSIGVVLLAQLMNGVRKAIELEKPIFHDCTDSVVILAKARRNPAIRTS